MKEIHFSRYRTDSPDDVIAFRGFLERLESGSKGFFQGLLLDNAELLQSNTLGCIGTLMDLVRAFISRIEKAGKGTQELLEMCLLTPGQHATILQAIQLGEEYFSGGRFTLGKARGRAA
jgi:hypothetical protein